MLVDILVALCGRTRDGKQVRSRLPKWSNIKVRTANHCAMTQAQFAKQYAKLRPDQLAAIDELKRSDKKLAPWIDRIGPITVPKKQRFDWTDALARSILYQQLNARAAETIVGRLAVLCGAEATFTHQQLTALSIADYRRVGVSGNKALALQSLAAHAAQGLLPQPRKVNQLDNEALINALTPIRGIGAWTVQMLLLFRLGRTDVWPVDDFGVRKGVQIAHKMTEMPSAKELKTMSERRWKPHFSLAALYFWRIADFQKIKEPT